MEPSTVQKVSIHGATLSAILQSLVSGGRDCDGLLFGSFRTHVQQHFHDDESEAITTEEHQAYITSAICCATTCSFYDAAGDISEDRLHSSLPPHGSHDAMIGWLSYRSSTPVHPSMREAGVTNSLYCRAARTFASQQQQQQGAPRLPPMLLLVVSSSKAEHGGATLTLDYRLYQASSPSSTQLQWAVAAAAAAEIAGNEPPPGTPVRLQPVELVVENLAQGLGHHRTYQSFQATARQLPQAAGGPGSPAAQQLHDGLQAAVAASGSQVVSLEAHYNSLLRQLHVVSRQVSEGAVASAAVAAENARLCRELEQLTTTPSSS